MRQFLVILATIISVSLSAQDVEIGIGDTLYLSECQSDNFKYIDFYKKSRIEEGDTFRYDTLMFWDFYNSFFKLGDFDVSRMPCSKSGKYSIIRHMMAITDDEGNSQTVIIALFPDQKSAAYITEAAFINEEVIYAPKAIH